jgi:hypothetical protein
MPKKEDAFLYPNAVKNVEQKLEIGSGAISIYQPIPTARPTSKG